MARSRLALLAVLALAGCAPTPTAAPVVVAPTPKAYTCDFQHQLAQDRNALPAGSTLRTIVDDYERERDELRAAKSLPPSPPCNPAAPST